MDYFPELKERVTLFRNWLELRKEQGVDAQGEADSVLRALKQATRRLERLAPPPKLARSEPDGLAAIRRLRPKGPRRIELNLSDAQLLDKLRGAWFGRSAGCILGIPCEGFSREQIEKSCKSFKMPYPLRNYWPVDPKPALGPDRPQYGHTPRKSFLRGGLSFIGADDDLAYTLLGLLILEEYGPDFSPAQVGEAWLKYLSEACTAEKVALRNLRDGLQPPRTAFRGNPYTDWIGADIRSDPWGYAAPGWLEKAAEFAWRDATVSHRAAGIHGEMYFSGVISAAFAVNDPVDALELGLTEVPRNGRVAQAARSALRRCRNSKDWETAIVGILKKYDGMHMAHTLNNLEITVAGLFFGAGDFEKTITLTVMGGLDTDCTGATAGSIIGAILGRKRLPKKWIAPLGNRVETYLIGKKRWRSDDVARRFLKVAKRVTG
jgi:ADP-ribosylglycohydrolase